MKKFLPKLDSLVFEIRYASGHLYFDRCGQCLLDIEREREGWLSTSADIQTGKLERPDKNFRLAFSNNKFDFTAQKAYEQNLNEIAKETSELWKIIKANLGLEEFLRVGYRLSYLLPTNSIDQAENLIKKAKINITMPDEYSDAGYTIKSRQIVTILTRETTEYRIQLGSVIRYEGIDPANILRGDPRLYSERQNIYRLEQLKQLAKYSADPMFAVNIDIDCAQIKPDCVSVEEFILNQTKIIEKDFLPILGDL